MTPWTDSGPASYHISTYFNIHLIYLQAERNVIGPGQMEFGKRIWLKYCYIKK